MLIGGSAGVGAVAGSAGAASSGGLSGSGGAPLGVPFQIVPEQLPSARVRWSYAARFEALGGGGAPYTFELLRGPLPAGLALTPEGELAGTPQKVGEYPVRLQARDAAGNTTWRDYVLRVAAPRFFAYGTFLSSSSTRTALHLADLTTPTLPTYTLADGSPNSSAFSPDGRWFAFCNHVSQGAGEIYVVDTSGDEPGPLLSLLEPGETSHCAAWTWSPDSRRIAYVRDEALWLAELNEAGVMGRIEAHRPAMPQGLSWPAPALIFLRDGQGSANLLRLDALGRFLSLAVVDAEQSTLLSASTNGALAFATGATGYLLVDAETGAVEELGHWPAWYASPTLELLLGRSSLGEFALYAPKQAKLPAPLRVDTDGTGLRFAAFANTRRAVAQVENGLMVMSEVLTDTAEVRAVGGTYDLPRRAEFDSDGKVLVFTDRNAVWVSDTSAAGTLSAYVASQHGPNAQNAGPTFDIGRSTQQLLAGGGDPYELRLVDFQDPQKPLVSPVAAALSWSESTWSRDDTHLAILGGSPTLGRILYLVTPNRPEQPTTVISCNAQGGAVPRCPGLATFQP
jgi:Putative Ig domain/WD40-like Beta Propeller Repeat